MFGQGQQSSQLSLLHHLPLPVPWGVLQSGGAVGTVAAPGPCAGPLCTSPLGQLSLCHSISARKEREGGALSPSHARCSSTARSSRSPELLREAPQVLDSGHAFPLLPIKSPAETSSSPGQPCKDAYRPEVLVVRRRNVGLRDTLCSGDGAREPLCSGRSSVPGKHSSQRWERSEKALPSRGEPGWGGSAA